jgi:poly-gamma-glutamate synthesis protein (capsule biosynthesis protein)
MNVANNHALDHGPFVMNDTLSHLSRAGIQYVGVQQVMNDSIQNPVIVHDPRMTVAFLGFDDINNVSRYSASDYPRPWKASEDAVIQAVTRARSQADVVVVTFHFGDEYTFTHSGRQEQLSHAAADAGADIIIGHHPHVIQDIEVYNTSIIAYSLGNFIFDMGGKGVREGAVLTVEIDPTTKQIQGHSIEKVTQNAQFQPRPGVAGTILSYYDRNLVRLYAIV